MAIVGTAKPPSPGASPAPYVTAWVYARYPRADAQRHVTVSFMVDTGADRPHLSFRSPLRNPDFRSRPPPQSQCPRLHGHSAPS